MEMEQALFENTSEIILTWDYKAENDGKCWTYQEKKYWLAKHRGKEFPVVVGKCTQKLLDRMKQYINWETVSISYDILAIIDSIEKTVLAQTEYQYHFAIVYEQKLSLYGFQQNTLTSDQWYEKFNTKADVGNLIGVTRKHEVLL